MARNNSKKNGGILTVIVLIVVIIMSFKSCLEKKPTPHIEYRHSGPDRPYKMNDNK